jgi:hypothetical protein
MIKAWKSPISIFVLWIFLVTLAGCGTLTGAAVGGAAGAGIGAARDSNIGRSAAIGAGVGGTLGAAYDIYGWRRGRDRDYYRE